MRRSVVTFLSLMLALTLVAATPKRPPQQKKQPPPAVVAPDTLPHAFALLLRGMSNDGNRPVTFRATAVGTRFFFEENGGVTVYRFAKGQYVKEEFLGGSTLVKAVKKYAK